MNNRKTCPVCGGTGEVEAECGEIDGNMYGLGSVIGLVDCHTCQGRGTIRPTQDPRYLFWAGVAISMKMHRLDSQLGGAKWERALWAANYSFHKCRAILANEPRRTTAKWRKPV